MWAEVQQSKSVFFSDGRTLQVAKLFEEITSVENLKFRECMRRSRPYSDSFIGCRRIASLGQEPRLRVRPINKLRHGQDRVETTLAKILKTPKKVPGLKGSHFHTLAFHSPDYDAHHPPRPPRACPFPTEPFSCTGTTNLGLRLAEQRRRGSTWYTGGGTKGKVRRSSALDVHGDERWRSRKESNYLEILDDNDARSKYGRKRLRRKAEED